jgi:TolA-binding protein
MEQEMDLFTQKRFELMIEMATKKLQQEMASLKEHISSLNSEIVSLKSQFSRLQFKPQIQQKKEVKIVDCRPDNERHEEFKSGAAKNAEPIRPRYGDYEPEDVSIDKFFYFGRR